MRLPWKNILWSFHGSGRELTLSREALRNEGESYESLRIPGGFSFPPWRDRTSTRATSQVGNPLSRWPWRGIGREAKNRGRSTLLLQIKWDLTVG